MATFHQRRSRLQERRAAKDLGGRVQKASGATDFAKGDVRAAGDVRAECKTTMARSYTLKKSEWEKIQGEANRAGETPVMQIEFAGAAGVNTKLAVISWHHYLALRHNANVLEDTDEPENGLFEDGVEDPL